MELRVGDVQEQICVSEQSFWLQSEEQTVMGKSGQQKTSKETPAVVQVCDDRKLYRGAEPWVGD